MSDTAPAQMGVPLFLVTAWFLFEPAYNRYVRAFRFKCFVTVAAMSGQRPHSYSRFCLCIGMQSEVAVYQFVGSLDGHALVSCR